MTCDDDGARDRLTSDDQQQHSILTRTTRHSGDIFPSHPISSHTFRDQPTHSYTPSTLYDQPRTAKDYLSNPVTYDPGISEHTLLTLHEPRNKTFCDVAG